MFDGLPPDPGERRSGGPVRFLLDVLRRTTLRTRLVLALLLPTLSLAVVLTAWALQRRTDAANAADARERVEFVVHLTRVYENVNFERSLIQMVGDAGGLERIAPSLTGLVTGQVAVAMAGVAAEMDGVATVQVGTPQMRDVLARMETGYRRYRAAIGVSGSPPFFTPAAERAIREFRVLVIDSMRAVRSSRPDVRVADTLPIQAIVDYRTILLRDASLVLLQLSSPGSVTVGALRESRRQTVNARVLVANQLSLTDRNAFLGFDQTRDGRRLERYRSGVMRGRQLGDATDYLSLMSILDTRLRDFQKTVSTRIVAEAERAEREARLKFFLGLWAAVGFGVLSVIVGLLALRPTTRTLRRLAEHTRRIGSGDLNVEPLVVPGRDEAAQLAASFNEMTGTLRTLQFQLDALAAERHEDPVLAERVPGHLGDVMARSMNNLAQMTSRLRLSEQTARLAIDSAVEAIWTLDRSGRIIQANDAAEIMTRHPRQSMLAAPIQEVLGTDTLDTDADGSLAVVSDVERSMTFGDVVVDALLTVRRVGGEGPEEQTLVFARDISQRKRFEKQLAFEATHDALTGLPNRAGLDQRLASTRAERIDGAEPVAVMFIDLDRFKNVNDEHGHRAGDELLRQVAARLRQSLRSEDVLMRHGGDEFIVVCGVGCGLDDAERTARRLIETLERPFHVLGVAAHISASIGIATADPDVDDPEAVRRADVAMYRAKQSGRGQVVRYDPGLETTDADASPPAHRPSGSGSAGPTDRAPSSSRP